MTRLSMMLPKRTIQNSSKLNNLKKTKIHSTFFMIQLILTLSWNRPSKLLSLKKIMFTAHWHSKCTTFHLNRLLPWLLTKIWNVGFLKTSLIVNKERSSISIKERSMRKWLKDSLTSKVRKVWLSCWLKFQTLE